MLKEHKTVALQFSGGKDSLATLYLMRPYWSRVTVLWCNTGDAFPETRLQMDAIKQLVPHFIEVKADQPAQTARDGYPSDAVSVWDTVMGRTYYEGRGHKVQTPFACCHENIWAPMDRAVRMLGATLVIRGQRNAESVKSPIRSGFVHEGIEYLFPIEHWDAATVEEYLRSEGVALPANYADMDSSLDCQHCTAYLFENTGKLGYMKQHHPALAREVIELIARNVAAADAELNIARGIIKDT
jgi:phosphoadenosine phosphosulfate reductase